MNPLVVQFVLPFLLGYTLYVGVADRFSPIRPRSLDRRPRWLLGVGTGLSVTLVVSATLTLATGLGIAGAQALLLPAGIVLAGLLVLTGVATLAYDSAIGERAAEELAIDIDLDAPHEPPPVADAGWDSVAERCERVAESLDIDLPAGAEGAPDVESAAPALGAADIVAEVQTEAQAEAGPPVDGHADAEMWSEADAEALADARAEADTWAEAWSEAEAEARAEADRRATEEERALVAASIEAERSLREEAERHLQITRKALFVLENEAHALQRHEDDRLALEVRLADSAREVAAAEARAERESFARIATETTVVEQREDLVRAQRDLRRNVEARARALAAASKALAHARQSTRARRRLEHELAEARDTIANRQDTISSLIRALETEKRRTRDDVASLAKQLVLHERQLKARRSLEEVARSVEDKLTSRLVKKVARARPVADAP